MRVVEFLTVKTILHLHRITLVLLLRVHISFLWHVKVIIPYNNSTTFGEFMLTFRLFLSLRDRNIRKVNTYGKHRIQN